ncbi:glutathione peroxidase activity protein [Paramecium bursaria]
MGNSGLRKLVFTSHYVENEYKSLHDITVVDIDLQEQSLLQYQGKKVLIVNVGSKSQLTRDQLQILRESPYEVLLFPSNQFKNEPGNYREIKESFQGFKVFQKVEINGLYIHPLYKYLKRNSLEQYDKDLSCGKQINQDYCKFLVDEQGKVIKFYNPQDKI